jgi:hypothetical protein
MICKISCSFGEIIDKITILRIKLSKSNNEKVLQNLNNELSTIENEVPLCKNKDSLYERLREVNLKLWELEDNIRLKSKHKEFDEEYIRYAEDIHITNDERYRIKRIINEKYNSELIEEKIYEKDSNLEDKLPNNTAFNFYENKGKNKSVMELLNELTSKETIDKKDVVKLNVCKSMYKIGRYKESYKAILEIIEVYEEYNLVNDFIGDIYISFFNICSVMGEQFPYISKIEYFFNNLNTLPFSNEFKEFFLNMYSHIHLKYRNLNEIKKVSNMHNNINGPGIHYSNMSFFTEKSSNENLLIYDGGGLGDVIMYGRFIEELCKKYNTNTITFLIDDKIYWLFDATFKFPNLSIVPYKSRNMLPKFHHHCNLLSLYFFLNNYCENKETNFIPYLKNIQLPNNNKFTHLFTQLDNIQKNGSSIYMLNWHGNYINSHETNNRGISLKELEPLLILKNTTFIIPTIDINNDEYKLLKKYNVIILKDVVNNFDKENAFIDTIEILQNENICGMISSDTSLIHLSATMNKETHLLLTIGCDWRWVWINNEKNYWYPNVKLYKQTKLQEWKGPVENIIRYIKNEN